MSEKDKYPSELAERFQVRLPAGLRDRIKATAEANGRSMNTEIVSTLEEAYPDPEQLRQELNFIDEIDEIQERLYRLRMAQMKDSLDENERMIKKADDLLGKPQKDKK